MTALLFSKRLLKEYKNFQSLKEIFIVINKEYRFRVIEDAKELDIDISKGNILLESVWENTFTCYFLGNESHRREPWKVKGRCSSVRPLIKVNERLYKSF